MMMRYFFLTLGLSLASRFLFGQGSNVVGLWKGAIIRTSNSVQVIDVEIAERGDSLIGSFRSEDWPYLEPQAFSVQVADVVLQMGTPYGDATLFLDTVYQEMIGTIGTAIPPLNIHLKRSVKDRMLPIDREELRFQNNGLAYAGDLYLPRGGKAKKPCIVIVSGRGCSPRSATEELARFFARQGMAAFAFDERGSEPTGVPCERITQDMDIADLTLFVDRLKKDPRLDKSRIGVFTSSAGAWTADGASLRTELAFMIQFVGPATSIKEQQLDGLRAFAANESFDPDHLKEAIRYTELLYSPTISEPEYNELEELLGKAKEHGWIDWLEDSDIPASKAAFGDLWVQRYRSDPSEALKVFKGPFLSLFGENDPVVPFKIQTNRLDSLFAVSGKKNYEIHVIRNGTHDLDQSSGVRTFSYIEAVGSSPYYYKFYRTGVFPLLHATDFLKRYGFLEDRARDQSHESR
jgi:pimeloyl-ACP methyl ester carboxylesterase